YGTVVDMQGGLTAIATPFLKAKGWSGNLNSFVTWWRRTHFENSMIDALLHREHTPYREIGHRAVAHVMDRAGIRYTKDEVRALVGEIEKLKPFPEVPAELLGLKMEQILFVANHAFDCIGAKSAGMRTAFIDRRSRPFEETPYPPD